MPGLYKGKKPNFFTVAKQGKRNKRGIFKKIGKFKDGGVSKRRIEHEMEGAVSSDVGSWTQRGTKKRPQSAPYTKAMDTQQKASMYYGAARRAREGDAVRSALGIKEKTYDAYADKEGQAMKSAIRRKMFEKELSKRFRHGGTVNESNLKSEGTGGVQEAVGAGSNSKDAYRYGGKVHKMRNGGTDGDKVVGREEDGTPIYQSQVDARKAAHQKLKGHKDIPTTEPGDPTTLSTMTSKARTTDFVKDRFGRQLMTEGDKRRAAKRVEEDIKGKARIGDIPSRQSSTRVASPIRRKCGGIIKKMHKGRK